MSRPGPNEGYRISGTSVKRKSLHIEDFDQLKVIGTGHYSVVIFARKRSSGRLFAMKVMKKKKIIEGNDDVNIIHERETMQHFKHPFIVGLRYAFQDSVNLYLCMDFAQGGELFTHLKMDVRFSERRVRFYAAEIFLAISFLHRHNIIYRDLKPENVLLDHEGHIVLCDFGLSKTLREQHEKTRTWCGTPEYLAPEVLLDSEEGGYTMAIDWWAFGVLLYEMLVGITPYYDEDVNAMYEHIIYRKLSFPRSSRLRLSRQVMDLVRRLLQRSPRRRLGSRNSDEIRDHPWFRGVDWEAMLQKEIPPPFIPSLNGPTDLRYIDKDFLRMKITTGGGDGDYSLELDGDGATGPADLDSLDEMEGIDDPGRPPMAPRSPRSRSTAADIEGAMFVSGTGGITLHRSTQHFENFSYSGSYSNSPHSQGSDLGGMGMGMPIVGSIPIQGVEHPLRHSPTQILRLTGSGGGSLVDQSRLEESMRQRAAERAASGVIPEDLDDLDSMDGVDGPSSPAVGEAFFDSVFRGGQGSEGSPEEGVFSSYWSRRHGDIDVVENK